MSYRNNNSFNSGRGGRPRGRGTFPRYSSYRPSYHTPDDQSTKIDEMLRHYEKQKEEIEEKKREEKRLEDNRQQLKNIAQIFKELQPTSQIQQLQSSQPEPNTTVQTELNNERELLQLTKKMKEGEIEKKIIDELKEQILELKLKLNLSDQKLGDTNAKLQETELKLREVEMNAILETKFLNTQLAQQEETEGVCRTS